MKDSSIFQIKSKHSILYQRENNFLSNVIMSNECRTKTKTLREQKDKEHTQKSSTKSPYPTK